MHILSRRVLREFWERHPDAERPLAAWYREVRGQEWDAPHQIIARYPNASIVGSDRVVFRIKSTSYRLVVRMDYRYHIAYIRFVGTHAEYNRIDAEKV